MNKTRIDLTKEGILDYEDTEGDLADTELILDEDIEDNLAGSEGVLSIADIDTGGKETRLEK